MAGRLAFREAHGPGRRRSSSSRSRRIEVTVPTEVQGDVLGDLNSRRGPGAGHRGRRRRASRSSSPWCPTAELRRYAVDLRSRTGGRGAFSARHDHYDVLPPNLVDAIGNGTAMSGVASVPT